MGKLTTVLISIGIGLILGMVIDSLIQPKYSGGEINIPSDSKFLIVKLLDEACIPVEDRELVTEDNFIANIDGKEWLCDLRILEY